MNVTTPSRGPAGRRSVVPQAAGHRYLVEFYESEELLVGTVAGFIGPSLNAGNAAIALATASHRTAFESAQLRSRVDVAAAGDRYLGFDAAERLAECPRPTSPSGVRHGGLRCSGLYEEAVVGAHRVEEAA